MKSDNSITTSLISTRGLSRYFGGLCAVDNLDFDLPSGELHALIGPNGAGKTSFVSLLCGRLMPSQGKIYFSGELIHKMPAHRRVAKGIAYTFQITSIFGNLSVYDNVALPIQRRLQFEGVGFANLQQKIMAVLAKVELAQYSNQIAGTLSYGHQRILEIAMGVALQPRLLILDEPTQGMSASEIANFIQLAREISKNATILLIEHNMSVVMDLAERITVLNFGKFLAQGTPAEIRKNQEVQNAYLGKSTSKILQKQGQQ